MLASEFAAFASARLPLRPLLSGRRPALPLVAEPRSTTVRHLSDYLRLSGASDPGAWPCAWRTRGRSPSISPWERPDVGCSIMPSCQKISPAAWSRAREIRTG